ncbi:hypothetical protein EIP91_008539 [Steccherinum ochraceum]|uniref:Dolichyl-diphosphooligosaccharide--protein glycosyltransferase subunit 4 n=1 Tax=Steccherinum ochraceum TaxID=92696 RepID=A0A4R0R2Q3_9APHY|nr:hypothetical protein EIP91_008539 [Steccherinum ochraceum]
MRWSSLAGGDGEGACVCEPGGPEGNRGWILGRGTWNLVHVLYFPPQPKQTHSFANDQRKAAQPLPHLPTMMSHATLYSLANSLGALAMFTVVAYHFVSVNAKYLERNAAAGAKH